MIYRYIYKITCTAGSFKDKFYFGQHTTENLDDNYHGSGRKLQRYYKKYPNDYIKEIISFYDSQEELNKAEYDIIHPHLNNNMCLNLMEGGGNTGSPSIETRIKISKSLLGNVPVNKGKHGYWHMTDEQKQKLSNSIKGHRNYRPGLPSPFKGKHHTKESIQKIRDINKGSKWMNDGEHDYYIKKEQIEQYLELGYVFGRLYKINEETKQKISKTLKGRSSNNKGVSLSEETKKKISESVKLYWINKKQNSFYIIKNII